MKEQINNRALKNKFFGSASKTIFKILAIVSLVAAYIYGYTSRDVYIQDQMDKIIPGGMVIAKIIDQPNIYRLTQRSTGVTSHISINETQGWGGALHTATEIDDTGIIKHVYVVAHRETPTFFMKLVHNKFFEQFKGKKINDAFIVGEDVDAVSRATISSKGFTKAVRNGSYSVARSVMKMKVEDRTLRWKIGYNEVILLLLFFLIFLGSILKRTKMRYVIMTGGIIFLGFYLNFPLSISHVSSMLMGFVPLPQEHLFWWLLISGSFLFILVLGKNLYCLWLCPFGALQEFLNRISDMRITLHPKVIKYGKHISHVIAWFSLIVIFITQNPAMGNYEPFAAMFGFEGMGVIWYILPVVLFSSFFIRRFWCRYFCPVGVVLDQTCQVRNKLMKREVSRES